MSRGAEKEASMCSNCSSDDLKPESFSAFDVSSPVDRHGFAGNAGAKRKRYRTAEILGRLIKSPLIQAIPRMRRAAAESGITGKFDPPSFVNLNSGAFGRERAAEINVPAPSRELIDIRVTAHAIIEVFATPEATEFLRNGCGINDEKYGTPWEESFAERRELERALKSFRRTRHLKYSLAYGVSLTCAAILVWYAFH